jgi:hypothetical protein
MDVDLEQLGQAGNGLFQIWIINRAEFPALAKRAREDDPEALLLLRNVVSVLSRADAAADPALLCLSCHRDIQFAVDVRSIVICVPECEEPKSAVSFVLCPRCRLPEQGVLAALRASIWPHLRQLQISEAGHA